MPPARIAATRRRRALARRIPSRAVRRANSPRPPRAAALAMTKAINSKLGQLEAVIERLLFPVLDEFAERGERPIAFSIDEPDDARTRVDAAIPRYVGARLEAIDLHLAEIFDERELVDGLEVIGKRVSTINATELQRVVGVSIREAAPEIASNIEAWRALNVSRIKSLAGQELVEITQLLESSELIGARVEVLRKAIEDRFSVTRSKAALLARDQTLTLNSQIAKARQQAVGISEYVWTTSGDERVRTFDDGNTDHSILDGKTFRWDTGADVGDGRMLNPGEDYQCRCTAFPVLAELA